MTTAIIVALVLVPALGAMYWVWLSMAEVEQDLSAYRGLDGLYFDQR